MKNRQICCLYTQNGHEGISWDMLPGTWYTAPRPVFLEADERIRKEDRTVRIILTDYEPEMFIEGTRDGEYLKNPSAPTGDKNFDVYAWEGDKDGKFVPKTIQLNKQNKVIQE